MEKTYKLVKSKSAPKIKGALWLTPEGEIKEFKGGKWNTIGGGGDSDTAKQIIDYDNDFGVEKHGNIISIGTSEATKIKTKEFYIDDKPLVSIQNNELVIGTGTDNLVINPGKSLSIKSKTLTLGDKYYDTDILGYAITIGTSGQEEHIKIAGHTVSDFLNGLPSNFKTGSTPISLGADKDSSSNAINIGTNVNIGSNVSIGTMVAIENSVRIGSNISIKCGAAIGNNITIKDNVSIEENISFYTQNIDGQIYLIVGYKDSGNVLKGRIALT